MSRRAEMPQTRRHILIFDEDWDWLDANYGHYSSNRIGTGVAVRKLIHSHVRALRQRVQDNLDEASKAEAEERVASP